MITVKNLSKHFGGIKAVDGVDLHIDRGSITGLVGPNGAGKTTMFNLIAGLYQPTEGEIILDGEDVTELTSHQLFHKGLLRTFQIAHEFPTLSVLENLMMVPANQLGESLMNTWLRRSQINEEEKALQEQIIFVLNNPESDSESIVIGSTDSIYSEKSYSETSSSVEDSLDTLGNIVIILGGISGLILVLYGMIESVFFIAIWGFAGILSALISGYILKGLSKIISLLSIQNRNSE